jgi:archaetidylinositol phosphate synthase
VVLERGRAFGEPWLLRLARGAAALKLTPNGLTAVSLALAFTAGALLWLGQAPAPAYLALGGLLVLASALLDAVDGRLARLQGTATKRGDYLDHVTDRYADLAILLGIGLAPGFDLRITLFAVIGTMLTSYMGTQAQAVGVGRDYKGVMTRADRLVLLGTVPLLQAALPSLAWMGLGPLALLLLAIGALGNLTALQRFLAGWRELGRAPPRDHA